MNQASKAIFRLRLERSSPIEQPAAVFALPGEIHGQPASYFWKDVISIGEYAHPSSGTALHVDASRLRKWADTGKKLIAAGIRIPINCDHSDRARDAVGQVLDFKIKGDRLFALAQLVGADGPLLAARNLVSVGIDPDLIDGASRRWGEAIVHLALTPVPVVPNQGGFIPASNLTPAIEVAPTNGMIPASRASPNSAASESILTFSQTRRLSMISIACEEAQFQSLQSLLPDGATMTPEDCIGRVIAQLQSQSGPEDDEDENDADSADDGDSTEDGAEDADSDDVEDAEGDNDDAAGADSIDGFNASRRSGRRHRILASRRLSSASMRALMSGISAQAQACVNRGAITPATRDRLIEALVQRAGKPNVLALSSATSDADPLAMQVFSILSENQPVTPGARTGLQALMRVAPDDGGTRGEPLYKKMAALADGKRVEL